MWYPFPPEIFSHFAWYFPIVRAFSSKGGFWSLQAFINVYKHYGSIVVDLDPRSKIQDPRKNFLDPRSGSKIQDYRRNFLDPQQNLVSDLGKLCLRIQEVFPGILDLGSWIRTLDPRSFFWNLRSWIQEVFSVILDLGSWIQTLGPRSFFCNLGSWIQEVFPGILDLGSRSTAMDP